jgi:ABC-type proline/glycine betaine transport system permease subunit
MPIVGTIYILFSINPVIGQGVVLFLGVLSMWLVVPLFFFPLGIFVRGQNVFRSILSGLQLARFTLPSSSLFVLSVLLISIGLNFVWSIPPADSWMSLVGILGHAFITTALLAASFIYYRDMSAWLQTVMERIKAGTAASQT